MRRNINCKIYNLWSLRKRSYCLHWRKLSRVKFKQLYLPSLHHLRVLKSPSTVALLGKIVAKPDMNTDRRANLSCRGFHMSKKSFLEERTSSCTFPSCVLKNFCNLNCCIVMAETSASVNVHKSRSFWSFTRELKSGVNISATCKGVHGILPKSFFLYHWDCRLFWE